MKCCLCNTTISESGSNNPWPLVFDPKKCCCNDCNSKVISARTLRNHYKHHYNITEELKETDIDGVRDITKDFIRSSSVDRDLSTVHSSVQLDFVWYSDALTEYAKLHPEFADTNPLEAMKDPDFKAFWFDMVDAKIDQCTLSEIYNAIRSEERQYWQAFASLFMDKHDVRNYCR